MHSQSETNMIVLETVLKEFYIVVYSIISILFSSFLMCLFGNVLFYHSLQTRCPIIISDFVIALNSAYLPSLFFYLFESSTDVHKAFCFS
ncbi:hypothetical protein MHYP_G00144160 [Metynnis hypsauchen]